MCQLLGMNCATPTDFSFSFKGFRQRGGRTDVHADGWGLAYYQGKHVRCLRETRAAAQSTLANLVEQVPIRTRNMMSHIRLATQGQVEPANVHPFQRELWGMPWSFCHNGDVPLAAHHMPRLGRRRHHGRDDQQQQRDDHVDYYQPMGQTDSERVFCAILNALYAQFPSQPSLPVLYCALHDLMQEIVEYHPTHTILNVLLTCGPDTMFAYSWPGRRPGGRTWNGLHYIVRQPPFCKATLRDVDDCTVDFRMCTTNHDRVSIVTTKPLTYETEWVEFQKGQMILFQHGVPQLGVLPRPFVVEDVHNPFVPRLDEGNVTAPIALSA